ncbi:MAG TPA: translation initiation factor Sui1 [Terriglobales bacterium]|nr:translation initiation factor Sui1 [Terriglobales bacterium]
MIKSLGSGPVYSTDRGRMCPFCARPVRECVCRLPGSVPKGDGWVRVRRETKGRGGKAVTVIHGVPLGAEELAAFAKQLKHSLSTGGTAKDGNIELQGDHRDKVVQALKARGWKVKLAGG